MKTKTISIAIGVAAVLLIAIVWFTTNHSSKKQSAAPTIGAILPLSGPSAKYGQWIKQGMDLALNEINASGGVGGEPLSIKYEDDKAQPAQATIAMQKLTSVDKVSVVFGSWASSCALAQAPIAQSSKTVMVAMAISPQLRDAGDYVFRIQPDARLYLETLVPYAYNQMNCRKMVIFYVNNDFGKDQALAFKEMFQNLGGQVIYSDAYEPNTTDFRASLTKIRDLAPDSIFFASYTELGNAVKQARELGITAKLLGSVPTENPEILKIAGEAAEGIVFPSHFNPESKDNGAPEFQLHYKAKYGQPAEGFAALAYVGVKLLAEKLQQQANTQRPLKELLGEVKDRNTVVGTFSFDKNGDAVVPILIKRIENQSFQTLPSN